MVGMGEVNVGLQSPCDLSVMCKLLAIVECDGMNPGPVRFQERCDLLGHRSRLLALKDMGQRLASPVVV